MVIESAIADGAAFFHLDALCSGLWLKMDFSMVWTVVANLCYRLFARRIADFEVAQPKQVHRRFINTPLLLKAGYDPERVRVPWLHDWVRRYEFG